MKTDKRKIYNWLMVFIINIIIFSSLFIYLEGDIFHTEIINMLAISIFATALPIYISTSNIRKKNHFGYSIPLCLLLPIPYFIWRAQTCTGKFCGLEYDVYTFALVTAAIVFAVFYTIGILSQKWKSGTVLLLSLMTPALIFGILWFLVFRY